MTMPLEEDRANYEPRPQVTRTENLMKIGRVVSDICVQCVQTD